MNKSSDQDVTQPLFATIAILGAGLNLAWMSAAWLAQKILPILYLLQQEKERLEQEYITRDKVERALRSGLMRIFNTALI